MTVLHLGRGGLGLTLAEDLGRGGLGLALLEVRNCAGVLRFNIVVGNRAWWSLTLHNGVVDFLGITTTFVKVCKKLN